MHSVIPPLGIWTPRLSYLAVTFIALRSDIYYSHLVSITTLDITAWQIYYLAHRFTSGSSYNPGRFALYNLTQQDADSSYTSQHDSTQVTTWLLSYLPDTSITCLSGIPRRPLITLTFIIHNWFQLQPWITSSPRDASQVTIWLNGNFPLDDSQRPYISSQLCATNSFRLRPAF